MLQVSRLRLPHLKNSCLKQYLRDWRSLAIYQAKTIIYQAPKLLGDAARAMAAMNFPALADVPEFEINEVTRIGADLRIIAAPKG